MKRRISFCFAFLISIPFAAICVIGQDDTPVKPQAAGAAPANDATNAGKPAEEPKVMTIGSVAPALDVQHWLSDAEGQFKPVTSFEKGKVYVIEFWATWCGPCIASMPHLAETQTDYLDRNVQLISVSDEDLETVENFLERPYTPREVASEDAEEDSNDSTPQTYGELTSVYCLTTDPDESVYEDYMRAAGQNGIPTAFIVGKSGLIEWIGHPMSMDDALQAVVTDSWDRDAYAEEFKKEQARDLMMTGIVRRIQSGDADKAIAAIEQAREKFADDEQALIQLDRLEAYVVMQPLQTKILAGETEAALEMIEEMYAAADVKLQQTLLTAKLGLQLDESQYLPATKTIASIADHPSSTPTMLNQFAWQVYELSQESDDVPEELVSAAIATCQKALETESDNAFILDTLAHLQYVAGDLDAAIRTQTKAVANMKTNREGISEFLEKLQAEKAKTQ